MQSEDEVDKMEEKNLNATVGIILRKGLCQPESDPIYTSNHLRNGNGSVIIHYNITLDDLL